MLFRKGIALDTCVEDWSYVGDCPLPTCDPGGCEDGGALREYVKCRLANIANQFTATWRPGDILCLGDSNTDILTAYDIYPMLPRAFNAAVLGSRVCDVTAALIIVQNWLDNLTRAEGEKNPFPSKVVVMVGTNDLIRDVDGVDNSFTEATAQKYDELLARLATFREANDGCDVIVRCVLPGVPGPSGCCTDGYQPDAVKYKAAVLEANAFLAPLCAGLNFTFLNDYDNFWNSQTDHIQYKLYRGGNWLNPCDGTYFTDHIHLGCTGQAIAMADLSKALYVKIPAIGWFLDITAAPFAAPAKSTLVFPATMTFRYARKKITSGESLTLITSKSADNYAAIFVPGSVTGTPAAEALHSYGQQAQVSLENRAGSEISVVLCLGTSDPITSTYTITSE